MSKRLQHQEPAQPPHPPNTARVEKADKRRPTSDANEAKIFGDWILRSVRALVVAFLLPFSVLHFLRFFDLSVLGVGIFSFSNYIIGQVSAVFAIVIFIGFAWVRRLHLLADLPGTMPVFSALDRLLIANTAETEPPSASSTRLEDQPPPGVWRVVENVRSRARRLRIAAAWTLVVIIVALAGGMAIFVQAGVRAGVEASNAQTTQDFKVYLVSSLSQRVGAVLLLVFLVQILVSLYRYNVRLAAFLDARADALELSATTTYKLPEIVAIFGSEHVDFGKLPSTPMEQLRKTIDGIVNVTQASPTGTREQTQARGNAMPPS
jgi:hypothetical protein